MESIMKKLVISALIAGISATAPLYAQTAAADSIEQQVFDKSFDVAVLSPQEMQETEGAFSLADNAIVVGAGIGMLVYGYNNMAAGKEVNPYGLIGAGAAGAFGGAYARITSLMEGTLAGWWLAKANDQIWDYNSPNTRQSLHPDVMKEL